MLPVVCDSREQLPFGFAGLPATVTVGTLEAGDYSIRGFERRVAVERKSLQDLVGCLGAERDRFERELVRLRGYDAAAVVVEEPMAALRAGHYRGRLDPEAAWQSILAFSMRYRVPFIFCRDRAEAEQVTYHTLRHFARDRWRELQALHGGSRIAQDATRDGATAGGQTIHGDAPERTPEAAQGATPPPRQGTSRERTANTPVSDISNTYSILPGQMDNEATQP
ncbi:MAG TPA: hypothetical protein DCM68_05110 [Verrucomicrobia bacterium]|nr:hypothetical protein [Verrucomicrobiota bacterium]